MAVTRPDRRPLPLGGLPGWVPPSKQHASWGPPGRVLLLIALVAVAGLMLGLAGEVGADASGNWAAIIVAALLLAISVPIAAGAARRDDDPMLTWILVGSAAAKLLGGFARYSLAYTLNYSGGRTDASGYYNAGLDLADQGFHFSGAGIVGTQFTRIVTGVVYEVIPPSRLAGFFAFSFMGWIGLFLFTRAFRIAFPDGARRRYDALVLFLPSMLFWPSSIGKEAWMTLTIGIAAYGTARLLAKRRWGFPLLAIGLLGTAMARPHVSLILVLAALVAYPVRRSQKKSSVAPITKAIGFGVLVLAALVVASQAARFFDLTSVEPQEFSTALDQAEEQSSTGGSEFENEPVRSVGDVPDALITIPFRPYLWEATDGLQLLAALEGLVLFALLVRNWRLVVRVPRDMVRFPYMTFVAVYAVGFVIAFSSVSNFGILVRQRVQLFPFLLLFVVPRDMTRLRRAEDPLRPTLAPRPPGPPATGPRPSPRR